MHKQQSCRPTRDELLAAAGKTVPDIIDHNLKVLLCGINPGLYSAVVGHHFARPGNRFWRVLHQAGFTDRLLRPSEERELLDRGCGITNLVDRATAAADELSAAEIAAGGRKLEEKLRLYKPAFVAVLGIGAYGKAFDCRNVLSGRQELTIGETAVWVLPNPSGLNAHYRLEDLAGLFRELRREAYGEYALKTLSH